MKKFLLSIPVTLLVMGLINTNYISAQTSFDEYALPGGITAPSGVHAADIDMDGDLDVVAGSGVNGIVWWRNDGGKPVNWTRQFVDMNSGVCFSVFVADIIRDGQPDIIALSYDRDEVSYYKNEGGDPIVWSKQIISTAVEGPHEVFVCDFDMDGNQDVFVASAESQDINWWHNNGGDPAQWTMQQISGNFPGARSVHVGDIDGDGDNDVAGAALDSDELVWWKNEGGNPVNWSKQSLSNSFNGAHRVQIADMDNDGDMDILGTAYSANEIAIWRNEDGTATEWSKYTVDASFVGAVIGHAVDIDQDGLLDILGTAQTANEVAWYRNKGGSEFSFKKTILEEDFADCWPAHAGDFDGDLDIDLLVGGNVANEIKWYENKQVGRFNNNTTIIGVPTNLGFFVPEEYDPNEAYKLIVALHICGDVNEYSRYRDNLIELCLEMNAILVAPDCHNTTLDVPDPAFILKAIEYASTRFNIDEEFVYLTGGSCNGRTALKLGLEKIYDFRGIIPFNAYMPEWTEGYYDFTSDMPVCFASGTDDPNHANTQEAYNLLMQNRGKARFIAMPGIAHEFYIPEFTAVMLECIRVIDSLAQGTSGIANLDFEQSETSIFPNPFNDNLTIQLPGKSDGPIDICIFNLMGQIVYNNTIFSSDKIVHLNLGGYAIANGLLVLQIANQENITRKRIIKY